MKVTSVKRGCLLLWRGLTGILVGIANWITTVLGMNDESKYGKFLRRTVGTCFTLFVVLLTGVLVCGFYYWVDEEWISERYDEDEFYAQYLSYGTVYYSRYGASDGYVATREGKKTIDGIRWIATPLGGDTLVCYNDGKKRGYFNIYTGEIVIEPRYKHAWVFSQGLAAVDIDGWIKFIDPTGKVVIDPKIPYVSGTDGYVFHNGYCIVRDDKRDRVGLIDRRGEWVLRPEYTSIAQNGPLWIVDNGEERTVLSPEMRTIIPFTQAKVWVVGNNMIDLTFPDHTLRRYNLDGELIEDFYISSIEHLFYDTAELRYATKRNYDEDGNLESITEDTNPSFVRKPAKCLLYEAEPDWHGLMSADGRIITKPLYTSITAIGYDMYLCKDNSEDGVLLNGRGERIK